MTPQNFVVDLHCHPAMKPYGRSFKSAQTIRQNSHDVTDPTSIWYYDPPTLSDSAPVPKLLTTKPFSMG